MATPHLDTLARTLATTPRRQVLKAATASAAAALLVRVRPAPVAAAGTADLAVTMVGDKKRLKYGKTMTLTANVTNLGPDVATGVTLGLGVSDSYANFGGTCPDGSTSSFCDLGTLAPGASVSVDFRVMACCSCCPEGIGVAVASVSHDAETVDPISANDSVRTETKFVGKAPF
jgi:uncharacterized repeat protein (TIGR01451 family)